MQDIIDIFTNWHGVMIWFFVVLALLLVLVFSLGQVNNFGCYRYFGRVGFQLVLCTIRWTYPVMIPSMLCGARRCVGRLMLFEVAVVGL